MNYQVYRVRRGDTLPTIAVSAGIEEWYDIVKLNELDYPYLYTGSEELEFEGNVKTTGEVIMLPKIQPDQVTRVIEEEKMEEVYGRDLSLFSFNEAVDLRELGSLGGNADGSIKLARGLDNLRQALIIKLKTPKGSLPLHPDFGSDLMNLTGLPKTSTTLTKIEIEVESTLDSDFRVDEVRSVNAEFRDNGIVCTCDIIPVLPQTQFSFSFEA